jgi:tetratricopeptide (TPR) repeat protein
MAPDNIPLEFFTQKTEALPEELGNELNDELAKDKIMRSITKQALAKRNGDFLSIHRLVQDVARHKLEGDTKWISCCLNIARDVFEYEYGNKQSMDAFKHNVQHILEITRHAKEMLDNDEEAQKKIAWLYNETGLGFDYSGQYNDALLWYQKALDIREKVFGKDNPKTISIYDRIAEIHKKIEERPS